MLLRASSKLARSNRMAQLDKECRDRKDRGVRDETEREHGQAFPRAARMQLGSKLSE
jgi:hypothetical protein